MTFIVVLGLVVVVILVVVLVALGMRANKAARDDNDPWSGTEQPRRPKSSDNAQDDGYGPGYDNAGYDNAGYDDTGYDSGEYEASGYDDAEQDNGGYDRRVAGAPLAAPTQSAPAPRPGRATEEMADDDYWATITFDKPKFPWQHDKHGDEPERDPADDPLRVQEDDEGDLVESAPAAATMTQPDSAPYATGPRPTNPLTGEPISPDPVPGGPLTTGGVPGGPQARPAMSPSFASDPLDVSITQQSSPQQPAQNPPLHISDPLGIPVARVDNREPEATQTFSSDSLAGYGDNPLVRPSAPVAPPAPPASPVTTGGGGADLDPNRLPTVDELLQRIQTDRQRTGGEATTSSYGDSAAPAFGDMSSSSYGDGVSTSYGDSSSSTYSDALPPYGDPLSGPLAGSSDSYTSGGTGNWSSSALPSSSNFDADPLRTVSDDSSGRLTGGALSGGYTNSTSSSSSGDGYSGGLEGGYGSSGRSPYSGDGYPSAPAYGDATRYDGSLGGSYGSTPGAGNTGTTGSGIDYGSFGSGLGDPAPSSPLSAPPPSGPITGENRYSGSDYSSGGYGGGTDPLGQSGYDSSTAAQGYGTGGYYSGSEGGYDSANTPPAGEYDPGSAYGAPYPAPATQPGSSQNDNQRQAEDWDNYRGFRT